MAKLIIVLDVDVDPQYEDPHEVAEDLLYDRDIDNVSLRQYAEAETKFISACWSFD